MLLQLLATHPEALLPILRGTPLWVWVLLASLLVLGISQLRDRTASLTRVSLLPLVMTIVSVSGTFSALHATPHQSLSISAWLIAAAVAFALTLHARGANAAKYDPVRRLYFQPGSVVPLVLIAGIFLAKYVVGGGSRHGAATGPEYAVRAERRNTVRCLHRSLPRPRITPVAHVVATCRSHCCSLKNARAIATTSLPRKPPRQYRATSGVPGPPAAWGATATPR